VSGVRCQDSKKGGQARKLEGLKAPEPPGFLAPQPSSYEPGAISYELFFPTPETINTVLFKEFNWTYVNYTTFVIFLWYMTIEPISKRWIRVQGKASCELKTERTRST
jgi:hypothetical protein